MSAHVLLNLLNELGKEIKYEACRAFYLFFATSLIIVRGVWDSRATLMPIYCDLYQIKL